jgi:uncharacterized protein YkwD
MSPPDAAAQGRPDGPTEQGPREPADEPAGAGRTGVVVIVLLVLVSTVVLVGPQLIGTGTRPRLLDQAVAAAQAARSPSPGAPTAGDPAYERQLVILVNAARLSAGCDTGVTLDPRLDEAAREHTQDMAAAGRLSHLGSDGSSAAERIVQAGYFGSPTAENIAQGYATPKAVMAAWMASPDRRANIVNCDLVAIGVGYAARGSWWTATFGG